MPLKIELSNEMKRLLNQTETRGLIPSVRTEFSKRGPLKVKQAIINDMNDGISPVFGKGGWVKYSDTYKDAIRGLPHTDEEGNKFIYRTKGGKSYRVFVDDDYKNTDVTSKAFPTKKVSPVNLRLSGKLHKDLKVKAIGGVKSNFRLLVAFINDLADIHNRRGAGKAKVVRRLLPNRRGEKFNRNITKVLLKQLKIAAEKVVKQFSGQ